jgi:hypothetical protein
VRRFDKKESNYDRQTQWWLNQRSTIIGNKRAVYTNQTFSANKDKTFSGNITVNTKRLIKLMATLLMLKVTNQWV